MNSNAPSKPSGKQNPSFSQGFGSIYRTYEQFYKSLKRQGLMPYSLTARGAWATSRPVHVFRFFQLAQMEKYRKVIDLGSGDGVVAHLASLFTSSVGIEIDESLCATARGISRQLGIPHTVEFLCEDYLQYDFRSSGADCLYIYPHMPIQILEERLQHWQGTVLIYGPHFKPKTLKTLQEFKCGRERMIIYTT